MKKIGWALVLHCLSLAASEPRQDDWRAAEYFENSSSQKHAAADLMKFVELKGHESILDVGCGDGKITAEIAAKVPKGSVIGLDISPSMITFAKTAFPKQSFPNLHFFIKDAQQINYAEKFDLIFSFTALQWIQDHSAFLEGASHSLKPGGTLAITMPMGLPSTLQQAVSELIASAQWASHFHNFSTGWNFVDDKEYNALLCSHSLTPVRLAVVPQKDIFPSREVFEKFITQWFPYLRPLPEKLKKPFLTRVIDRFLELESPFPNGEIHFKIRRLEAIAVKTYETS